MTPLVEMIRAQIAAEGPVEFAWFMEQALYAPGLGYYASGRARIGTGGDFFTNVSVGKLWAEILQEQLRRFWEELGRPGEFTVIEQGAHDGIMAADILASTDAAFRESMRYVIVEPVPEWQSRQAERLGSQVAWVSSLEEIPRCVGVHLSNELLDAIPVQLVRREGNQWRLLRVGIAGDAFIWVAGEPVEHPELPSSAPEGFTTELHPFVRPWVESVARVLARGFLLVADYGMRRENYYAPERSTGTLRGYQGHSRSDDPLTDVGEKDLTTHVNWSRLEDCAAEAGFESLGVTDQSKFVVEVGACLVSDEARDASAQKRRRQFVTLMHPELMGRSFQVARFRRR